MWIASGGSQRNGIIKVTKESERVLELTKAEMQNLESGGDAKREDDALPVIHVIKHHPNSHSLPKARVWSELPRYPQYTLFTMTS